MQIRAKLIDLLTTLFLIDYLSLVFNYIISLFLLYDLSYCPYSCVLSRWLKRRINQQSHRRHTNQLCCGGSRHALLWFDIRSSSEQRCLV